jgi:hypothetical protein
MNTKSGNMGIVIAATALSLMFGVEISGATAAREAATPAAGTLTGDDAGNDRVKVHAQTNADRAPLRLAETKVGARAKNVRTTSERTVRSRKQCRTPTNKHFHWWSGRVDDCPRWR